MKSSRSILSNYNRQLQSDQWQAFSKTIRRERGNVCHICKQSNKVTHVHHIFYDFDRPLHEYGQDEVLLLCAGCHKQLHEQLKSFRKHVFRHLKPQEFRVLNAALAVGLQHLDPLKLVYAIAELCGDKRAVELFFKSWTDRN